MAGSGESDCYMWFPKGRQSGLPIPEGETTDEWFSKVGGFQLYRFTLGVGQTEDSDSPTPQTPAPEPEFEEVRGLLVPRSSRANYLNPPKLKRFAKPRGDSESSDDAEMAALSVAPAKGAKKTKFNLLEITRDVDTASVDLFYFCTSQQRIPIAIVVSRIMTGQPLMYLQYVFQSLRVTEIEWSTEGTAGSDRPDEKIKFSFLAMGVRYYQQQPDGSGAGPFMWAWTASDAQPNSAIYDALPEKPEEGPAGNGA